jgi:DNA gyrase/topoisomerase IV subunit B
MNTMSHIACLLLTFFFRFYRKLIEDGKIFISATPLYSVKYMGKRFYLETDADLEEFLKDKKGVSVTRFKGLGEMNADQLWDVAMNPITRKLIRVSVHDLENSTDSFFRLMGKDPEKRKEFIIENANLAIVDI